MAGRLVSWGFEVRDADRDRLPSEVWVLLVASFLIAIGYGLVAPALPVFAASFDVGVAAASFVISAFAIVRLLFAPVSGRMVSAFGEQPVYLWGLIIVAVSTAACAWAGSYWQLLVFRAAGGIGSTMFTVSAIGLLLRLSPPGVRGRAAGLWSTCFLLGNIGGPMAGGLLAGLSIKVPFITYGVTILMAAWVTWFFLRKSQQAAARQPKDVPELTFRAAARHPAYRASLASAFANGWMVFGIRFSLIPLFVLNVLRQGEVVSGWALSAFAAGTASVLMVAGRLTDVRGRRPLALAGLLTTTIGALGLGFAANPGLLVAACAVTGIGSGLLNPAQTAAVADVIGVGARGGPVLAAFQMAADFGAIVGPLVAGAIADVWSYQAAFALTGLISLAAFFVWLLAPETLVGGAEAPPTSSRKPDQAGQATPGSDVCGPAADTSSS